MSRSPLSPRAFPEGVQNRHAHRCGPWCPNYSSNDPDGEEKGSDVNLATRLLTDAVDEDFEQALVIFNDSDLTEPIRMIKQKFKLPIVVISPYPTVTNKLRRAATSYAGLDKSLLATCQLRTSLEDKKGRVIIKPTAW